jgi:Fic family protein
MKLLMKELCDEIKEKYEILNNYLKEDSFNVKKDLKDSYLKSIEKDIRFHSWMIENPGLKPEWCIYRNSRKKIVRQGIKNLENAFLYGINNFDISSFDQDFLKKLSFLITPELYLKINPLSKKSYIEITPDFRDNGTFILGASTTPPYPEKMREYEIPWFINSIKNMYDHDIINKIETAIFSHLHLARIHPFKDGNGRLARIFQDIILFKNDLPSPKLEPSERYLYYELLDKAILSWDERKAINNKEISEEEFLFNNFIASKINLSYDKLLCRLLKNKNHQNA